uniref:Uncharacterized protein ycf20 n=1 Tax=Porphyridium sordidum TaxID=28024 RepID=A0A1C9CDX9_PORSO|nr:hypothetical protein Psor_100 [Porphyridium sordidum]AOM66575.1 hypothetical protein Psor_100 [Porphyridium sordidum]
MKTKISTLFSKINKFLITNYNNSLSYFACNLIALLLGFFFANALATLPGQTGEWGIVVSGLLVAITEIISKIVYTIDISAANLNKRRFLFFSLLNNIKLGIIYGFFVDSFKLGS